MSLYKGPKIYLYNNKMLDKNGKVTSRVTTGLENVLSAYTSYIPAYSVAKDNNPKNFQITKAYIVGSGARENRVNSDLDLLLIAPTIDEATEKDIKVYLSSLFFNNTPKHQAIDVFVRPFDRYAERESFEITNQVKKLLKQYNKKMVEKRKFLQ